MHSSSMEQKAAVFSAANLCYAAVLTALVFILTFVPRIPIPLAMPISRCRHLCVCPVQFTPSGGGCSFHRFGLVGPYRRVSHLDRADLIINSSWSKPSFGSSVPIRSRGS